MVSQRIAHEPCTNLVLKPRTLAVRSSLLSFHHTTEVIFYGDWHVFRASLRPLGLRRSIGVERGHNSLR